MLLLFEQSVMLVYFCLVENERGLIKTAVCLNFTIMQSTETRI